MVFGTFKTEKEYDDLFRAARSRVEVDWLVKGINATRALTCKYNAQLFVGVCRPQTLAMITKPRAGIKSFKPQNITVIRFCNRNEIHMGRPERGNQRISWTRNGQRTW